MIALHEKCYVCGQTSDFEIDDGSTLFREAVCPHCGSSIRHSDLAQAISDHFASGAPLAQVISEMDGMKILDASPVGESYRLLSTLPGCVGCEFFPDIPTGDRAENGLLCVDLTAIPFPDHTFDLIITEETLEHISDLKQTFSEISRVLKPGGVHIFTIPICETIPTRSISDLNVTHPALNGDSKVFHEFGLDIANILERFGFFTRYRMAHRFYPSAQTTDLRKEYAAYCTNGANPLAFFQYNSIVFISEKVTDVNTPIERIDLQTTENLEVVLEHIHRYRSVLDIVEGKTVLDAACGTGYGTKLLSERAKKVVGIDIDAEVVKHLQKEEMEKVSFACMPVEAMTFADNSFDVVVSFETIEHIEETAQKAFLAEVRRVLKPGGCLIISTPNVDVLKETFKDYYNPFHVKELTRVEFFALLSQYFKYTQEYYQNVVEASCISSTVESVPSNPIKADSGKYLIAVCSDQALPEKLLRSAYFPEPKAFYHELHQSITEKANLYVDTGFGFRQKDVVMEEVNYQKGYFHIVFGLGGYQYIRALRFDPLEGAFCRVRINSCCIDGVPYSMEALNATESYESFDYFFHSDPQYFIQTSGKKIEKVEIEGYLDHNLSKRISQICKRCYNQETQIAAKELDVQKLQQLQSQTAEDLEQTRLQAAAEIEQTRIQAAEKLEQAMAELEQTKRWADDRASALETAKCRAEEQAEKLRQTLLEEKEKSEQQLQEFREEENRKYRELEASLETLRENLAERERLLEGIQKSVSFKITRPLYRLKTAIYFGMEKNAFTRRIRKAISVWRRQGFGEMLRQIRQYREKREKIKALVPDVAQASAIDVPMYEAEYQPNKDYSEYDTDVKVLAFHLPQFHTFPENDAWWGKGFTEWTNVRKGCPRFDGHYQPRVPHEDIGYYCLEDVEMIRRQAELAKQHGIYGFCYYYYWFSGKRLMEKPVDLLLRHPEINIPFCLCWANENWTRRWDGQEQDVLIKQEYSDQDDEIFIADLKKYLDDSRYIRVNGKPVIVVYSPCFIPDCRKSFQKWRETARALGIGEIQIWICLTWGRTAENMQISDCVDAEVEFPPHNLGGEWLEIPDVERDGQETIIYDYKRAVDYITGSWGISQPEVVPKHLSCMMAWDNAARRKDGWHAFYHFSLKDFYRWLQEAVRQTRAKFPEEERFFFINAWNEWGEGTYLEPDEKYGYANINTVSKAVFDLPLQDDPHTLVLDRRSPVGNEQRLQDGKEPKIAVQAHVFYVDLLGEIIEQLNRIPYSFDLFITTDTNQKRCAMLPMVQKTCRCRKVEILVLPNRGRDVAPFLAQMAPKLDRYDYVGHIHTKRTITTDYGDQWRKYLFRHLFGNEEYLRRMFSLFEKEKTLGIVMPEMFPPIREHAKWTGEHQGIRGLLRRMGVDRELPEQLAFPAGNMFWVRTAAVKPLFALGLRQDDFPEEAGQRYATLAHQIERAWVYVAEASGYEYRNVINGFPPEA